MFAMFCVMYAMFPSEQRKAYPDNKAFVQIVNNSEDIKEKLIELRQQYAKVLSFQPKIFKIKNYVDGKYEVIYKEYFRISIPSHKILEIRLYLFTSC